MTQMKQVCVPNLQPLDHCVPVESCGVGSGSSAAGPWVRLGTSPSAVGIPTASPSGKWPVLGQELRNREAEFASHGWRSCFSH